MSNNFVIFRHMMSLHLYSYPKPTNVWCWPDSTPTLTSHTVNVTIVSREQGMSHGWTKIQKSPLLQKEVKANVSLGRVQQCAFLRGSPIHSLNRGLPFGLNTALAGYL